MLLKNFAYSLVPFAIVAGTLLLTWWYVVIHPQVGPEAAFEGVQQLGTPGLVKEAVPADLGPPQAFFWWFAAIALVCLFFQIRYYSRLTADRLEVIKLLSTSIMPLGLLTVVVLGVILFGITTATESAGVGAAGAFLLAFQARTLDWKRTKEAVFLTAKTTAMVCWLFVGSALFSGVFAILGGQALVEQWVLSLNMTPIQFMILSQAIIFVLGWPLEWTEIIVIFVPIFLPLLKHFNIDPVLWAFWCSSICRRRSCLRRWRCRRSISRASPQARHAEPDFRRHDALHADRHCLHDHHVHLARHDAVVAELPLWRLTTAIRLRKRPGGYRAFLRFDRQIFPYRELAI